MQRIVFVLAAAVVLAPQSRAQQGEAIEVPLAVRGLDPVELCQGREAQGRPDLTLDRGGYTYRFASPSSRDTFQTEPERYEIQMAGACARMGPLSGRGDPARFAVHDGRIYIFASDACRKGFLAAPERHLDRRDPIPELSETQRTAGRDLLAQAVEAHGGAPEIDATKTLRMLSHRRVLYGKEPYHVRREWLAVFPERTILQTSWNSDVWTQVLDGERGVMVSAEGERPMATCQRDEHRAQWHRQFLPLLRARTRDDFVAGALGRGEIAGLTVDRVAVAFAGKTLELGIDPVSHRLVALRCTARVGGPFAELEQRFEDFREVGGLLLPYTVRVRVDGKDAPREDVSWTAIERDMPVDEALFAEQAQRHGK
ncbi:MAG: hypothetical protein R3F56_01470 [Planctomycetota bacterium]